MRLAGTTGTRKKKATTAMMARPMAAYLRLMPQRVASWGVKF